MSVVKGQKFIKSFLESDKTDNFVFLGNLAILTFLGHKKNGVLVHLAEERFGFGCKHGNKAHLFEKKSLELISIISS